MSAERWDDEDDWLLGEAIVDKEFRAAAAGWQVAYEEALRFGNEMWARWLQADCDWEVVEQASDAPLTYTRLAVFLAYHEAVGAERRHAQLNRQERSELSMRAFAVCVAPYPLLWFGAPGLVARTEGEPSQLARLMDAGAATDYVFRQEGGPVWGIASRCDFDLRANGAPHRTFTVRSWTGNGRRSEYDRLRAMFEEGALGPGWHVHLGTDGRRFLCGAAVRTGDLMAELDRQLASPRGLVPLQNPADGARFYSLRWGWFPPGVVRVVEAEALRAERARVS